MSEQRVDRILDRNGGNTARINGIPLRPGFIENENRIINGDFNVNQRQFTSSGLTSLFPADRWVFNASGGTINTSREAFSLGDTLGSSNATTFVRHTVSGQTLASHFSNVAQNIEGVRSYAGQTITVLGWARRSSGTGNMAVSIDQHFGSGGSPSPSVLGNGQTVVLSSSWQPFAVTFNVSSITGKLLGTANNDRLSLVFWYSAGSDFNARTNSLGFQSIGIDLWGIHIKTGTHAAEAANYYTIPEVSSELAKCQRYFVRYAGKSETLGFIALGNGYASAANTGIYVIQTPVTMRVNPGITFSGTITGTAGLTGQTLTTIVTLYSSGPSTVWFTGTFTGGSWTVGQAGVLYTQNAPTNFLSLDSEVQ